MPKDQESASENDPIGPNIFRLRRKLNITQRELAAPEYSTSYVSAIERGRIRPSLKALETLARRLGVTTAELLTELPKDAESATPAGAQGKTGPKPSLADLIKSSPSYLTSLVLVWAAAALEQRDPGLARDLLDLLPPGGLRTDQELLRLLMLGRIQLETGHPVEAQALLEPVFHQAEFVGYDELLERCRFRLACAYAQQEKFLLASETFSACVQGINNGLVDDPLFAIEVYTTIAEYYRRLSRYDTASAHYQLALGQLAIVSNPTALAASSARLSRHHLENGRSSLAYWYAARSRAFIELAETYLQITQAASNLGLTLQEMDEPVSAAQQFRQAIDLSERFGVLRQGVLGRLALAELLFKRDELQEAEKLAREAEALCRPGEQDSIKDVNLYGHALVILGVINRVLGRLDDAEQCFKQAIGILQGQSNTETLEDAYFHYSELLNQRGETAEGFKMINQAYVLRSQRGERMP